MPASKSLIPARVSKSPDHPLLAVVVLSVDAPPELSAALRSLIEQDLPAEIVVINSGGGDGASRVPSGVNVRVLNFPERLWPGAARNRGIEATAAPFVGFLASDCRAAPGWIAARLAAHQSGSASVGSTIVNLQAGLSAAVAHSISRGVRDAEVGRPTALQYGGSYARWLFDTYGKFREDVRVGEDTEFNLRLDPGVRPEWNPEVRTAHLNPETPWGVVVDQVHRGRRLGQHWPEHSPWLGSWSAVRSRTSRAVARLGATTPPHDGLAGSALTAFAAVGFQIGFFAGRRGASPEAAPESRALGAVGNGDWRAAAAALGEEALRPSPPETALAHVTILERGGRLARARQLLAEAIGRAQQDLPLAIAKARMVDDPADEVAAWTDLLARFGGRPSLRLGLARALLRSGDFSAATATFEALRETWPDSRTIVDGLIEVAVRSGELEAALLLQRGQWETTGSATALAGAIATLHRLKRWDEARSLLAALRSAGDEDRWYSLSVMGFRLARDAAGLLAFVDEQRDAVDATPRRLETAVQTLNVLGQPAKSLEIIARGSRSRDIRQTLEIRTLFHEGRLDAAWRAFEAPPGKGTVRRFDLLRPLVSAAYSAGTAHAAHDLLARISPPRDPAKGLIVEYERIRVDAIDKLTSKPPAIVVDRERRRAVLLAAANAAGHENLPGSLFGQLADLVGAADHPLDPETSVHDAIGVAERVVEAIETGRPLSLVRLGDGEGTMLPHRPAYRSLQGDDLSQVTNSWWGWQAASHPRWGELVDGLVEAARHADILGIPDATRIARNHWNAAIAERGPLSQGQRGLLAAMEFAAREHHDGQALTSCHVHQALAYWGLWDVILHRAGAVSVITGHAGLGASLEARFGVRIDTTHLIPTESKYKALFSGTLEGRHFPDAFDRLRPTLAATEPGHVVLVAAGMLGKIYCEWIRQAGGIALDVGSAADHWCGHATRTPEENASYASLPGIGDHLQALADVEPRMARLLGRAL